MNSKYIKKNRIIKLLVFTFIIVAAIFIVNFIVDGHSDAESSATVFVSSDTTVHTSENINVYGIYDGKDCIITIDMVTGSYTGDISFGYYSTTLMVYVPFVSVALSDVDEINLIYSVVSGSSIGILTIEGISTGNVHLNNVVVKTGNIIFGCSDHSCSGTVYAADSILLLSNAENIGISVIGSEATVFSEGLNGSVLVDGVASIGDIIVEKEGILSIKKNAIITMGGEYDNTYDLSTTYSVYGNGYVKSYTLKDVAGNDFTSNCTVSAGNIGINEINAGMYTLTILFSDDYNYIADVVITDQGAYYILPLYSVLTTGGTAKSFFLLEYELPSSDSVTKMSVGSSDLSGLESIYSIQDGNKVLFYGLEENVIYAINITQNGNTYSADVVSNGNNNYSFSNVSGNLTVECLVHFYYSLSDIETNCLSITWNDVNLHYLLYFYSVSCGDVKIHFIEKGTSRMDIDMIDVKYVGYIKIPVISSDSSIVYYSLISDEVESVNGKEAVLNHTTRNTNVEIFGILNNNGAIHMMDPLRLTLYEDSNITGSDDAMIFVASGIIFSTSSSNVIFNPPFTEGNYAYGGINGSGQSVWTFINVITASAGNGGSISPSGSVIVNSGSSQTFTITALSGYAVSAVMVDGTSIGSATTYTFSNVTANHTISATFTNIQYVITASAGNGGSISPSGSVIVNSGSSQTFTITALSGYAVSAVMVDGTSIGSATTYTFSNVTANHTISATFTNIQYVITASAGNGGSISPSGSVIVNSGSSQTFTITALSGYAVSAVMVDGTSIGSATTYTFSNVTANHTISATFTNIQYVITASAGNGGSISPSGSVIVNSGSSQTFTITALSGYAVSAVMVDGTSIGSATTYTFSNVTANHTISASFKTVGTYTITATAGEGGSISPSGAVSVPVDGSQIFIISYNTGYKVDKVLVDGTEVSLSNNTYTFSEVQVDHTISVTFKEDSGGDVNIWIYICIVIAIIMIIGAILYVFRRNQ